MLFGGRTMRFIGRQSELASLEKINNTPGFQMTVIYGRRRVGKSTLIRQFLEGKRAVYFTASKTGIHHNLSRWGAEIVNALSPELSGISFSSIEALFSYIGKQCEDQRTIIVIDELPYLCESDGGFLSLLQNEIDNNWSSGQMYLILCGSSISFMENEVLGSKSPIFGRRTSQLRVKAFDYKEAAEFVPSYSYEDKAVCYGVTGGIAKYLSLLDPAKTLDENLIDLFFSKDGYLYEEPTNLLSQEFRNITTYNDIIEAIASGANRVKEIADKAHLDETLVSHGLKNLIETDIVTKNLAITDEPNNKKTIYSLKDGMFRFWYRFIPGAMAMIEIGRGEQYYYHFVKPQISQYMGNIFEDMCRYFALIKGADGTYNCYISSVGKWWGSHPEKHEQTDIDVVCLDTVSKKCLLGECKYTNDKFDKTIFEELTERDGLIDKKYTTAGYLLFSKSGFTDWVLNKAKDDRIYAYTLSDLYDK